MTARAAADGLLRCAGRWVKLRVPFLAAAGDVTEQLGLATPQFQDVALGPVVYRKARATVEADGVVKAELMVSASAVERLTGSGDLTAAQAFFAAAFGVLIDGVLMQIVAVTPAEVGGEIYMYRVVLQMPLIN